MDRRVREALYPGCKTYTDFAAHMGHNAIIVDLMYKKEKVDAKRWQTEWGPGGVFILSSSNPIHSGVKPENYVAMLNALREYGRYS